MIEASLAFVFLLIFVGSSAGGTWLHDRMTEHHRTRDAVESVRLIVTILVTFSALVLGLLVTSAKEDFDSHTALYQKYGIDLVELDHRLIEYGPQADPIRHLLRSYTAAVFALSWPGEPRPSGEYPTALHAVTPGSDEMSGLTVLMNQMDNTIETLSPADAYHQRIALRLQEQIHQVQDDRWHVIERTQSKVSAIFVGELVMWLAVTFLTFGLVSPNTSLVHITVFLAAFTVAASLYLIMDLYTPLGGFISVSSRPFQDALWHMDHAGKP